MTESIRSMIQKATGASDLHEMEVIQSLWSGYGTIARYDLAGAEFNTVIVKHVQPPSKGQHPRGWNTNLSHQRKMKSYQVEVAWFESWNQYCDEFCRVPICLGCGSVENEMIIVLEDLDAAGFSGRRTQVTDNEIKACLSWLAHFHATFLNEKPLGIWEKGTYWHLNTRPDELEALTDSALKKAAGLIDQKLHDSPFKTFVHGDAKLANFCFSDDGQRVAAVDFQYVGGGCGMKDVAYFIGSCLSESECERQESQLLDYYFDMLKKALALKKKTVDPNALEKDWRALYPVACADFHRFLKGWSPGHWKIHSYSELLTRKVVAQLNGLD